MLNFFPISSGMFISAYEDKTGTLDQIEEKIARATMIPRKHGEVLHFRNSVYFCSVGSIFSS